MLEDRVEDEENLPPGYDAPHAVTEETTAEQEEERVWNFLMSLVMIRSDNISI